MTNYCKYGFYTCAFIGQVSVCSDCEDGDNYEWNYYISPMQQIFKYIKADQFFPAYLPHIKNYKRKISGRNGRGNPVEFSELERKEIKAALIKLFKDLN